MGSNWYQLKGVANKYLQFKKWVKAVNELIHRHPHFSVFQTSNIPTTAATLIVCVASRDNILLCLENKNI